MRHLLLAVLMLSAFGAVVLAAKEPPDTGSEAAKKDPSKPINKFCPIERENEADPKVTTTYDKKLIGFCCADCIDKFKTDPKKYMKDLK